MTDTNKDKDIIGKERIKKTERIQETIEVKYKTEFVSQPLIKEMNQVPTPTSREAGLYLINGTLRQVIEKVQHYISHRADGTILTQVGLPWREAYAIYKKQRGGMLYYD